MANSREVISTEKASAAIGPYSQAIRGSGLVFVSGSIGRDPETGEMIGGGVAGETAQALKNLSSVLEAGGASLASVVKTTVFLDDMGSFGEMNEVYATFFPVDPPARSTIEVAALPASALVEIEAIALVGE